MREDRSIQAESFRQILKSALSGDFPDIETIKLVIKLACSTASGSLAYFAADHHQANRNPSEDDIYGKLFSHFYWHNWQWCAFDNFS